MSIPRKRPRRSSRAAIPLEPTRNKPLLLLASAGIALVGLGLAYLSFAEISALVASLRTHAPAVETMDAVYLLPVLALAFLSLGALLGGELLSRPTAERVGAPVMAVLLGTVLLLGLFGLTGGIVNSFLMTRSGYEPCETRSGTRVAWTLWAKAPGGCAAVLRDR